MNKGHFFERMERENDYQKEYEKLEHLCSIHYSIKYRNYPLSINEYIEGEFRSWKRRSNYTTYSELREELGFRFGDNGSIRTDDVDLNKYLLFCEMLFNILFDLQAMTYSGLEKPVREIIETINATIGKIGMETRHVDNEIIIVEKNAVTSEIADKIPELADIVVEYNHYLLRGDLKRKQELLKHMADYLEPKRSILKNIDNRVSDDYFFLVNTIDIRHNNSDPNASRYHEEWASLSVDEKEDWYDLVYEQGLTLLVLLEQQERNERISEFKRRLLE